MKKFIASIVLLLVLVMALGACQPPEPGSTELNPVKRALEALYAEESEITLVDFTRPTSIEVEGVIYTLEWNVEVTEGLASDVKVILNDDGTVTIDVGTAPANSDGIEYTLTATISNEAGITKDVEFDYIIPYSKLVLARNYLYEMYKDASAITGTDFTRVSNALGGGQTFPISWTVDVTTGNETDVTVSLADNVVTIDVPDRAESNIAYDLVATITDAETQNTLSLTYHYTVPKFEINTFAEYAAAEKDANLVIQGIVTGIISKTDGRSSNCLYIQDLNDEGGYYVYGLTDDPKTTGIEIGMKVLVTGQKDIYSGTYELVKATVEVLDDTIATVTPVDFTTLFTDATALTDTALVAKQGMLVTINDVSITGQDTTNGYYKFELDGLESYIRISSSVCPLTNDEKNTFIADHTSHLGYIADATGVICVYNGAFYLTPVTVGAFNYISLPERSDAEKVAFEKENLAIELAITEDGEFTLDTVGQSYNTVTISWASDNACAVIDAGKVTYTLPEDAATVTITATITCGEVTDTKTFSVAVDAASTSVYVAKPVAEPAVNTAYKLAIAQNNLGLTLYFAGTISGNYLQTTDKAEKAVDVFMEAVEGGFQFYFMDGETKTYIDINTSGKAALVTATPNAVFTLDATLGIYKATVGSYDYYLGTYNQYNTISASKTSYINADNIDVSQFPARLCEIAYGMNVAEPVAEPAVNTAYKLAIAQNNLGLTLYFAGTISGNYLQTTDKAEKAVDVFMEAVEGGFQFYFMDGETKTYIDINTSGKAALVTATPNAVFTLDATLGIYKATVGSYDYYLGTYNQYNTISASKTSYINADNIDVSQFPARLSTIEIVSENTDMTDAEKVAVVKEALTLSNTQITANFTLPVAGEEFGTIAWAEKVDSDAIAITDGNVTVTRQVADTEVVLVATITVGEATDTKEFTITVNAALALTHAGTQADPYSIADALLVAGELATGGFTAEQVYITGIVTNAGNDNGTYVSRFYLADTISGTTLLVYSCNDANDVTSIAVNDTVVIYGKLCNYNGTLEVTSFTTMIEGVSTIVYPTFISKTAGTSTITVDEAIVNATVTNLSATSGLNGSTFTFNVTPATGYVISAVKVNGVIVTADAETNVYTGTVNGNTVIVVETAADDAPVVLQAVATKPIGPDSPYLTTDPDTTNYAANISLDETLFTVNYVKNACSNASGFVRLNPTNLQIYSKAGMNITINAPEGKVANITRIVIKTTSTKDITVNGTAYGGTGVALTTDIDQVINATTVSIVANGTAQIKITGITIYYTLEDAE
ncbi:MAG: hypothetical protein PHW00_01995 [Clostridia bacterium]|nr:hypothetical protein [Clostridia bacterium]